MLYITANKPMSNKKNWEDINAILECTIGTNCRKNVTRADIMCWGSRYMGHRDALRGQLDADSMKIKQNFPAIVLLTSHMILTDPL